MSYPLFLIFLFYFILFYFFFFRLDLISPPSARHPRSTSGTIPPGGMLDAWTAVASPFGLAGFLFALVHTWAANFLSPSQGVSATEGILCFIRVGMPERLGS
ncbi:hypothetical protein BDV59DRAFT_185908 [Aspergillus ambiguus]|uniref:uncharacterized protein n=1 Tax=Aspergillus ambiguus TaxID=176160 RepID=UPI003CCE0639